MTLADDVLPLIRARSGYLGYRESNIQGDAMHRGIDILEAAMPSTPPGEVHIVTQKALASALKVIARADDSAGVVGDACRRLIKLHPQTAAAAAVPPKRLVAWMMKFQFDSDIDYFELDPVAYAPALGEVGMKQYRAAIDERRAAAEGASEWSHDRFTLDWNDRRLAVYGRDVDAIIRTHAREPRVAAFLIETSDALAEIGAVELAIEWARNAVSAGPIHQSVKAGDRWADLLAQHHPEQVLAAREFVFSKWPNASTATALHSAAGDSWPDLQPSVMRALERMPWEAVGFARRTLKDLPYAWKLAHQLDLDSDSEWAELAKAYEKMDRLATLPVHLRLVEGLLVDSNAANYRRAAQRLARMKKLAKGTDRADWVEQLIADLRESNRRRPRLQQEFDRAGL